MVDYCTSERKSRLIGREYVTQLQLLSQLNFDYLPPTFCFSSALGKFQQPTAGTLKLYEKGVWFLKNQDLNGHGRGVDVYNSFDACVMAAPAEECYVIQPHIHR